MNWYTKYIISSNLSAGDYGAWISPEGEVYPVKDTFAHEFVALEIIFSRKDIRKKFFEKHPGKQIKVINKDNKTEIKNIEDLTKEELEYVLSDSCPAIYDFFLSNGWIRVTNKVHMNIEARSFTSKQIEVLKQIIEQHKRQVWIEGDVMGKDKYQQARYEFFPIYQLALDFLSNYGGEKKQYYSPLSQFR